MGASSGSRCNHRRPPLRCVLYASPRRLQLSSLVKTVVYWGAGDAAAVAAAKAAGVTVYSYQEFLQLGRDTPAEPGAPPRPLRPLVPGLAVFARLPASRHCKVPAPWPPRSSHVVPFSACPPATPLPLAYFPAVPPKADDLCTIMCEWCWRVTSGLAAWIVVCSPEPSAHIARGCEVMALAPSLPAADTSGTTGDPKVRQQAAGSRQRWLIRWRAMAAGARACCSAAALL